MIGKLLPAMVLVLFASAPKRTQPDSPLQVAVEDSADPWSRPDGTGFANDVVRAAFRAGGGDVSLVVVPYARCRKMVIEGSVVACLSMSPAPDLTDHVAFPAAPLFVCYSDLFANPARPVAPAPFAALRDGLVVGTVLGYEYPEALEQARRRGHVRIEESPSEAILVRKLAAGRIDAALLNVNESKPVEYVVAQSGVPFAPQRITRVGELKSYVGFSRRHARAAEARRLFERGMQRITSDGTLARVTRQWADTSSAAIARRRAASPGTK